jgi:hypothetical protein
MPLQSLALQTRQTVRAQAAFRELAAVGQSQVAEATRKAMNSKGIGVSQTMIQSSAESRIHCPTVASPTKTHSGSCGLSKRLHPKAQCSSRLLSWGSFQRCPSTDITGAPTSQLNRSSTFDLSMPILRCGPSLSFLTTPTALCAPACGFVAPRSQPWGSPGFRRPPKRLSSSLAHTLRSFSLADS